MACVIKLLIKRIYYLFFKDVKPDSTKCWRSVIVTKDQQVFACFNQSHCGKSLIYQQLLNFGFVIVQNFNNGSSNFNYCFMNFYRIQCFRV